MSKAVRLYVLLLRVRPTRQNRSARLRAGDSEDHIPFFVRPPKGRTSLVEPRTAYTAMAWTLSGSVGISFLIEQAVGLLSARDHKPLHHPQGLPSVAP